jgi:hypothetical protein
MLWRYRYPVPSLRQITIAGIILLVLYVWLGNFVLAVRAQQAEKRLQRYERPERVVKPVVTLVTRE